MARFLLHQVPEQNRLCHSQSPAQTETGPPAKKVTGLSKRQQLSIKPSVGPFSGCKGHTRVPKTWAKVKVSQPQPCISLDCELDLQALLLWWGMPHGMLEW